MAKAKSYKLQGREWTVKALAEELGLSTPRVHGLLKEHNEDIKAIFASRGITSINNPPQPNKSPSLYLLQLSKQLLRLITRLITRQTCS